MSATVPGGQDTPVMRAEHLAKRYPVKRGWLGRQMLSALADVSFRLERGRTLAVVGESGCGKSTLARQLTMVETPSAGRLEIGGECVFEGTGRLHVSAAQRRQVQMVFQNPMASLNPRKTVAQTLDEPLRINLDLDAGERAARVAQTLQVVGLRAESSGRYPHMFSGGQRQRVAIARAMILNPRVVVADEPTSALDVSIQAQILNLFMDLQQEFGTSYVFISHNLSVVEHIADDVLVMYLGRVVEGGAKDVIFRRPRHPYTRTLMSATPALLPENRRIRAPVIGEAASPLDPPSGCTFRLRCPYAIERCTTEVPPLRDVDEREVACHRAEEIDA